MRLLRLLGYAAAAYLLLRIGFPDRGPAGIYDGVTIPLLIGGAVGVFILLKAIDLGSRSLAFAIELGFAAGAFLYLGFTMPQSKGAPPLSQLLAGERPTQATAREGLRRLGLDPQSASGRLLASLFPER